MKRIISMAVLIATLFMLVGCNVETTEVEIVGHQEVEVLQNRTLKTVYYLEVKRTDGLDDVTYFVRVDYKPKLFNAFEIEYPIGTLLVVNVSDLKDRK